MLPKKLTVTAIPAFTDNYIWAIGQEDNKNIALVDPGEPQVCIDYITKNKLKLCAILVTHHHADHTGGIETLRQFCLLNDMPLTVYGPANETIPCRDIALTSETPVTIDEFNTTFSIIDVPGHTAGHIAYFYKDILFCGDTLFSAGCGRIFNGTAKQLFHSLSQLKALPDKTKVYCTHEYTQANIAFALAVEPKNSDLCDYANKVRLQRENNQITLPSSIALEKKINPFLRCDLATVSSQVLRYQEEKNNKKQISNNVSSIDPVNIFTLLRQWKDTF